MSILWAFAVAIGLSIDNFIIAISLGCNNHNIKLSQIIKVGVVFSIVSLIMFGIGWEGGITIDKYIEHDNIFSAVLLALIAGRMIYKSFVPSEETVNENIFTSIKILLIFSFATSFDALAVGISLTVSKVPFLFYAIALVSVGFILNYIGFKIGTSLCKKANGKMGILSGIILLLLAVKIFMD